MICNQIPETNEELIDHLEMHMRDALDYLDIYGPFSQYQTEEKALMNRELSIAERIYDELEERGCFLNPEVLNIETYQPH